MLYLHGKNPLVPNTTQYIITGAAARWGRWVGGQRGAQPGQAGWCVETPRWLACRDPAGDSGQGMTGGTIGGMVVADAILGELAALQGAVQCNAAARAA